MSDSPLILLVGHCGFDSGSLKSMAQQAVPGSRVVRVSDTKSLDEHYEEASLLLVNRLLDGRFFTESGIELIRELACRPDPVPMMLISNYDDAQAQALTFGALPGFGKSAVDDPEVAQRITTAVHSVRGV